MREQLYQGTSLDLQTGKEKVVYLTPEEIAALPAPPTLDERNKAIKAQRNAAMADPINGSDGLYLYAVFTGNPEHMEKWRVRRQEIIDAYPEIK
jgi:hypothetical protein